LKFAHREHRKEGKLGSGQEKRFLGKDVHFGGSNLALTRDRFVGLVLTHMPGPAASAFSSTITALPGKLPQ